MKGAVENPQGDVELAPLGVRHDRVMDDFGLESALLVVELGQHGVERREVLLDQRGLLSLFQRSLDAS